MSMQLGFRFLRIGLMVFFGCAICVCGMAKKAVSDPKGDYKSSKTIPSLEVPPDLTLSAGDDMPPVPAVSSTTTYSSFSGRQDATNTGAGSSVLPEQGNLRVQRDGDRQWLIVHGEPDQLWPVLRRF